MAEYREPKARYIDINKVKIPKGFFDDLNVPKLFDWLNSQPTADVVKVVRCKDCKHCKLQYPAKAKGEEAIEGYYCYFNREYVKPAHYCSLGELKEREGND